MGKMFCCGDSGDTYPSDAGGGGGGGAGYSMLKDVPLVVVIITIAVVVIFVVARGCGWSAKVLLLYKGPRGPMI